MDKKYNIITAIVIAVVIAVGAVVFYQQCFVQEPVAEAEDVASEIEFDEQDIQVQIWEELGYESESAYNDDFAAKKEAAVGMAENTIATYADVIDDEQIETLMSLEDKMINAEDVKQYNGFLDEFNAIVANCEEKLAAFIEEQNQQYYYEDTTQYQSYDYQPTNTYYESNGSGLTKSGGVNWYNGRKETWYSSNTAYHYRTNEWTVDNEGFYRDSNGYYVVAASDMPQGTVFEGSKGTCIVSDSGCSAGVTDYYTKF